MLVLYRFSTYPEVPNLNWSLDLNQGPKDYESSALTTELMARNVVIIYQIIAKNTISYETKNPVASDWIFCLSGIFLSGRNHPLSGFFRQA